MKNISEGEPFVTTKFARSCRGPTVGPNGFPAINHLDSRPADQVKRSCLSTPQPNNVDTSGRCTWACVDKVFTERLLIFYDECDLSTHPFEHVDHSGFGYVMSQLLSGLLHVVESLVSIVLTSLIEVLTSLLSTVLCAAFAATQYLRPIETITAFFTMRFLLRGPFLYVGLFCFVLLSLKLNPNFI
nr:putative p29 [Poaceae Liege blunervirus]